MAHLVERSLATPEVLGSNLAIGEILVMYSLATVLKRRKEKRGWEWPISKKTFNLTTNLHT